MLTRVLLIAWLFLLATCETLRAKVAFDWALVGNVGNQADDTGRGAVDYVYQISKFELTNAQFVQFLNAVDPAGTNSLDLYPFEMSSDANSGLTLDNLAPAGTKYQVKPGRDIYPVFGLTYLDAVRFVNWLENGQGEGSTENGTYVVNNGTISARNPHATFFIPNADEWYKAAYHQNDGVTGNYWEYPTSTDQVPFSDQPPGNDAPTPTNAANFMRDDGVANGYNDGLAVTGKLNFDSSQNYLTPVGAYSLAISPYGTFDQGGNVWELTDPDVGHQGGDPRGGDWFNEYKFLAASHVYDINDNAFYVGLRVASVPEPNTGALVMIAALTQMIMRRRRW